MSVLVVLNTKMLSDQLLLTWLWVGSTAPPAEDAVLVWDGAEGLPLVRDLLVSLPLSVRRWLRSDPDGASLNREVTYGQISRNSRKARTGSVELWWRLGRLSQGESPFLP